MEIADRALRLHGRGHAYHVKKLDGGEVAVAIHTAPMELSV
jgi:hypothetical protein